MGLKVLYQFLGIYSLLLVIAGTIGNILILFVTCRLKKQNTFVYLRFLAVSDLLSLYYWNLDKFVSAFTSTNFQAISVTMCKIGNFTQYTTLQFSSWMLVIVAFDRFVNCTVPSWSKSYMTHKRALVLSSTVLAFFVLINLNILFTVGAIQVENNVTSVVCHPTNMSQFSGWISAWAKVNSRLNLLGMFLYFSSENSIERENFILLDIHDFSKTKNKKRNSQHA